MYGSKDLNLSFTVSGGSDNQDKEESNLFPRQNQNHHRMSSELVEYPPHPAHRSAVPETESMFARFMADKPPLEQRRSQLLMPLEATRSERELEHSSSNLRMLFQSPQQLQTLHSESPYSVTAAEVEEEEGEEEETRRGVGVGASSNLVQQRSTPAGFFSPLNVDSVSSGFNMIRGLEEEHDGGGESSSGRLKGQLSFSSRQGSDKGDGTNNVSTTASGSGRCNYIPGYPVSSWEDSVFLSDNLSGGKRPRWHPSDQSAGLEMRDHRVSDLSSSESNPVMERYLEFQDAVPCKIRAKRGCATHPRSIAERVRRTKISERMRKLQELVPNMDKQMNTSDMLDLAVEHIKDLQKTIKTLSDDRGRCRCEQKT